MKSVWWSVTAYGDEIALLEGKLPEFVREVRGGRETCPTTGLLHFQGAIQLYEQSRMAKIKSWLKKAHLEPARAVDALKRYVMKAETAAGEKTVRTNPVIHLTADQMCMRLASVNPAISLDRQTDSDDYYKRVRTILSESPELAGQLMNPSLRNFWIHTANVWIERAIVLQPDPDIITHVDDGSHCVCDSHGYTDRNDICRYCVEFSLFWSKMPAQCINGEDEEACTPETSS